MTEYPIFQASSGLADDDLELLLRDDLQAEYQTGALLHVGDTQFRPFSFAGTSPVVAGTPINDVAETSAAARMRIGATGSPTPVAPVATSRGIDFSGVNRGLTHIELPASIMAALDPTQNFHFCLYMTFPSAANWPPGTLPSGRAIIDQTTGNGTWSNQAELFSLWMASTVAEVKQFRLRRQTSIGNSDTVAFSPVPDHFFAAFSQVSIKQDEDGVAVRVRNEGGDSSITMARGTDNTENLAARLIRIGCGHWTQAGLNAQELGARTGLTFGRWWVARPEGALRDWEDILDADWARTLPRFPAPA